MSSYQPGIPEREIPQFGVESVKQPFNLQGLTGIFSSLLGGLFNFFSTKDTNRTNQNINQQNLDYNTAMTQAQWERDDTAHQREVADLKAAGLSPLAATGGAGVSQALGAPNPIAMQAPQLDTNTIVQALIEDKALNETKRHNLAQEGAKNIELSNQAEEIELKVQQLDLQNKELQETISYNSRYITAMQNQLNETNRHNTAEENLKKQQYISEAYLKQIQQQTHGKFNYKIYHNNEEYQAALEEWSSSFQQFINTFLSETSATHSESNTKSWNAAAGAELPLKAGGNLSGGSTSGSSASNSFNVSQKQQAQYDQWIHTHPMPVFIYEWIK